MADIRKRKTIRPKSVVDKKFTAKTNKGKVPCGGLKYSLFPEIKKPCA